MEAYKCDRCGNLYEKQPENNLKIVNGIFNKSRIMDLCPECYAKLEKWFMAHGAGITVHNHNCDMLEGNRG